MWQRNHMSTQLKKVTLTFLLSCIVNSTNLRKCGHISWEKSAIFPLSPTKNGQLPRNKWTGFSEAEFMDLIWQSYSWSSDVFLGPVCPYVLAPVARFSGKWNIPVLTMGGQASTFRQKEQHYPLLTTMGGNYEQFAEFFVKLLRRYSW